MLKYLRKQHLLPTLYADYNKYQPTSYFDYENYQINPGQIDDYEVYKKIGQGKYSEVFRGNDIINNTSAIIKILKPNQMKKIQREVLVLQAVSDHQNIIKFKDVVQDQGCQRYSLIFEDHPTIPTKQIYQELTLEKIKFIIKNILQALDYAHSKGVFHRDIKPQNILTDFNSLRVIDWGLAEFYHPHQEYNVRVASRYFKGPELLLDIRNYHYSLDTWSVGCIMAGMIFQNEPFFRGTSNDDQLVKIVQILGSDTLKQFLKKYSLSLPIRYQNLLNQQYLTKKKWHYFINEQNEKFCQPEALDLIDQMLNFDCYTRILAHQALKHPFFN